MKPFYKILINILLVYSIILVQVPVHVYAQYCHKRVEKMTMMGAKKGLKKPSLDEIQHAKVFILLNHYCVCGTTVTVLVQIFGGHIFRCCHKFSIFAILFSRITGLGIV